MKSVENANHAQPPAATPNTAPRIAVYKIKKKHLKFTSKWCLLLFILLTSGWTQPLILLGKNARITIPNKK